MPASMNFASVRRQDFRLGGAMVLRGYTGQLRHYAHGIRHDNPLFL